MISTPIEVNLPENNFLTIWQTVIFRNYGFVPTERIAKVLKTSVETIDLEARRLGLKKFEKVCDFENQGYITIIRNNWFLLPYNQLCELLNFSEERLRFVLKEEDFLMYKLGEFKPKVKAVKYKPLSQSAIRKTQKICDTIAKYYENGYGEYFNFFDSLKIDGKVEYKDTNSTRIIHGYITPCGDPFSVDSEVYMPDALLKSYASKGVNAVFVHGLLSSLSYYPFSPSKSVGFKSRREKLQGLVDRCLAYGIKVYLYINEPRYLEIEEFKKFPYLKGKVNGDFAALCFTEKEVQDYLYNAVKDLFTSVNGLGGVFTITMSENITHCKSRPEGIECPKCKDVPPEVLCAQVNNVINSAIKDSGSGGELIANTWGWSKFSGWTKKQTDDAIKMLDKDIAVLAVSEFDLEIEKGGVKNRLTEYTLGNAGPSKVSKEIFKTASKYGHKLFAKIQIAASWECACVPYVPAFDITYKHLENLSKLGIKDYLLTWTLGGYPSPYLDMVSAFNEGVSLNDWYNSYFNEDSELAKKAVKKFCKGMQEYPCDMNSLYYSPETLGPANLWDLSLDGKTSCMVGCAYDKYEDWVGVYGYDVYVSQLDKLLKHFKAGIKILESAEKLGDKLKEILLYAKVCYNHMEASLLQTKYSYLKRNLAQNKNEIKKILKLAKDNAERSIYLFEKDCRIAYETSNHYFYNKSNLVEKVVNCNRLLKDLKKVK